MNDLTTTVVDVRPGPDIHLRRMAVTHFETSDSKEYIEIGIDNTSLQLWRKDAYALMLELERMLTGSTSEEEDE